MLRDRGEGVTRIIGEGNHPSITENGRHLLFAASSMDQVAGADVNGDRSDIYITDLQGAQARRVSVELTPTRRGYRIEARVRTDAKTGVEMEALTAVSVAALTIYDMVKAVDKEMVIGDICLVEKSGGRSGQYRRSATR